MGCAEHDKLRRRYERAALEHEACVYEFRRNNYVGASELLKQAVCETRLNAEIAYDALMAHERIHHCAEGVVKSLT